MDENERKVIIEQLMTLMSTQFFILFDALHQKKVIDYANVQEAINVVRDIIPKEKYFPAMKLMLDQMEQTYQPGRRRPISSVPGDPQP